MKSEEWRAIPGYEGLYEASSLGRVRSLDHMTIRHWKGQPYNATRKGQICKPDNSSGYARVSLYSGSERLRFSVHDLISAAFIGPKPVGRETCHNDGMPLNNWASNLRYDTHAGNLKDRLQHGTHTMGEQHPMKKIGEHDVRWIKKNAGKISLVKMAERLGVSACCVGDVVHGRTWKHLEETPA